jgi:hypothetical protein
MNDRPRAVIIGHDLDVGTTHDAMAKFFTGPYNVDLIAKRESAPFLVPQGPPCQLADDSAHGRAASA